jgi:hypothetical protein
MAWRFLGSLALASLALTSSSCESHQILCQPFFQLHVTYDLETATGAETTCQALGLDPSGQVVGVLADSVNNQLLTTGSPASCAAGMGLVEDSGVLDGGVGDFLALESTPGLEDLYVRAFDASGKLVAFGRVLGAVPEDTACGAVLSVHVRLKAPTVALCGDGNPSEPGKSCDDYLDNHCCNCSPSASICPM